MPKFKKEKFYFIDQKERRDSDVLEFECDISINSKGDFYTNLPVGVVDKFKIVGITGAYNPKTGIYGYFEAKTFDELKGFINELGKEYLTKEVISKTIKIEYSIETTCTYAKTVDGLFPNGYYVPNGAEDYWREGTKENSFRSDAVVYGLEIYAMPFIETIYQYKSGKLFHKKEFNSSYFDDAEFGDNGKWLQAIVRQKKPSGGVLQEIEYTEETAGFFKSIFESLFAINEKIKGNFTPEKVKLLSQNFGQKLLNS